MAGGAYTIPTIGITGSPKDYTGIVAARQRQEAADKGKAAAEQRKEDKEIADALYVKPGEMLNARIPDAKALGIETIKKMEQAKASGASWSELQDAQQAAIYQLQAWKEEKKAFDEADKRRRTGAGITPKSVSAAYTAKDSESLRTGLGQGAIYDEQAGTFRPKEFDRLDLNKRQLEIANNFDALPTGKKAYDFNGQPYELLAVDVPKVKKAFEIDFDSDELVRENAISQYENSVDTKDMAPEDVLAAARKNYVDGGVALAKGDTSRRAGGAGQTINFYAGGAGDGKATPFAGFPEITKYVTTDPETDEKVAYETKNYFGHSFGDVSITTPVPGGATYVDSGEPVNDADIRTGKFNQFLGKVLLKKDWYNPINKKTYPKGSSIPEKFENAVIEAGIGEAGIVAMGLANGQSIQYSDRGLNSSAFSAQTEKEKEGVVTQLANAERDKKALQADIDRRRLAAIKREAAKKKVAPAPKPVDKAKDEAAPKGNTRVTKEQQKMLDEL
jgi:hypothetical protein